MVEALVDGSQRNLEIRNEERKTCNFVTYVEETQKKGRNWVEEAQTSYDGGIAPLVGTAVAWNL